MLPAFMKAHIHPLGAAMYDTWVQMTAFDGLHLKDSYTLKTCMDTMRKGLDTYTVNNWALGFGLDPAMLQSDKETDWPVPTKALLDAQVSDTVCVLIMNASGPHVAYENTPALKTAGVESEDGILLEMPETMPVLDAPLKAQT